MNHDTLQADDMAIVRQWFNKARIDYEAQYVKVYISYNAWYQRATGKLDDREALTRLKQRFVIWDDYYQGRCMQAMRPYFEMAAEYTQREPLLTANNHWSGSIESTKDWQSLIEYWYQVRCILVHGGTIAAQYIRYAYETLFVFMEEIIFRLEKCLPLSDAQLLYALTKSGTEIAMLDGKSTNLTHDVYQRYMNSQNSWEVDMKVAK